MKKYWVRAIALVLLASITFATDNTIRWVPPVFYTNGVPLLEQDLDFYTLYCDGSVLQVIDSVIGTRTEQVHLPKTEGNHICYLTVTTLVGVESAPSNDYSFSNLPLIPAAPVVDWVQP